MSQAASCEGAERRLSRMPGVRRFVSMSLIIGPMTGACWMYLFFIVVDLVCWFNLVSNGASLQEGLLVSFDTSRCFDC